MGRYRLAITTDKGKIIGKNFNNLDDMETYLIETEVNEGIKFAIAKNKETGDKWFPLKKNEKN